MLEYMEEIIRYAYREWRVAYRNGDQAAVARYDAIIDNLEAEVAIMREAHK